MKITTAHDRGPHGVLVGLRLDIAGLTIAASLDTGATPSQPWIWLGLHRHRSRSLIFFRHPSGGRRRGLRRFEAMVYVTPGGEGLRCFRGRFTATKALVVEKTASIFVSTARRRADRIDP